MPENLKLSRLLKNRLSGLLVLCLFVFLISAEAAKFNAHKRYLYVQPGQSIFSIVKVLYPDQQEQWPKIIKKIVKINPHAFVGADATKIRVGERLELPSFTEKHKPVTSAKAVVYKKPRAVGQVISQRGKTFVLSSELKSRNLEVGSEVFVGDRIYTGVKGFVRLRMIDNAKIDLRCNSEMLIEDYQLVRGGNRSVIYLIKGSVKKITGSIGKLAEDIYEMRTPLATVGVRGTEYAIRVLQAHGCDGSVDVNSKGMFVKVNRGSIDIKTASKTRTLNTGEAIHMEDEYADIEGIQVNQGVFEAVQAEKKSYLFGSSVWLLWLLPIIIMLRKK